MEDSESDEDDYLPLAAKVQATESKDGNPGTNIERERQETPSGVQQTETIAIRPSAYETATARRLRDGKYTIAREAKFDTNRRKNELTEEKGKETERDESEIPQTGSKKRGRKQRLVSYSSQDSASSLDETSSRCSRRKRKAVTKMGAVMIDNIQKAEKPGTK